MARHPMSKTVQRIWTALRTLAGFREYTAWHRPMIPELFAVVENMVRHRYSSEGDDRNILHGAEASVLSATRADIRVGIRLSDLVRLSSAARYENHRQIHPRYHCRRLYLGHLASHRYVPDPSRTLFVKPIIRIKKSGNS
jgi:hypothetical protein